MIYRILRVFQLSAFQDKEDPAWAYVALESVVHLNTLFKSIYVELSFSFKAEVILAIDYLQTLISRRFTGKS